MKFIRTGSSGRVEDRSPRPALTGRIVRGHQIDLLSGFDRADINTESLIGLVVFDAIHVPPVELTGEPVGLPKPIPLRIEQDRPYRMRGRNSGEQLNQLLMVPLKQRN